MMSAWQREAGAEALGEDDRMHRRIDRPRNNQFY